jgi:hypothetical protein
VFIKEVVPLKGITSVIFFIREVGDIMDKTEIISDIQKAKTLSDYEAVEALWNALVKMANVTDRNNELQGVLRLIDRIPEDDIRHIMNHKAVGALIFLDPPLEAFLASQQERQEPEIIEKAIGEVRSLRQSDPREALKRLGEVLKGIRDKKADGFKTPDGPRDSDILAAARSLLSALCNSALKTIK